MAEPRIVIEHLTGSRRGQRQEFAHDSDVRFGRHPDSDVHFHAHRDMDASSRHAVLAFEDGHYVLRDVGSSNGTYVDDELVTRVPLELGDARVVEFGAGGPRVRVFVGDPTAIPPLPVLEDDERGMTPGYLLALAGIVAGIVVVAVIAWFALV